VSRLTALADPRAVVFDLDGTLVDTVATRIEAWLATFAEVGIPATREPVASLIGSDGRHLAREIAARAGRVLSEGQQELIDKRSGEIFDLLNQRPRPVDGARGLLLALEHSELAWAIATSSRAAQVEASIAALELPERPPIIDGSHVAHAKPAPDLLLLAAERLERAPAECWYAGDATWDMLAAAAAGMVGIGLAYGAASPAELEAAGARATTTYAELMAEMRRRGLLAPS
jgi:HAD superfamily hydrolase (TIGR01509 family)